MRNLLPDGAKSVTQDAEGKLVIEWTDSAREVTKLSRAEFKEQYIAPVVQAKREAAQAANTALAADLVAQEEYHTLKRNEAETKLAKARARIERVKDLSPHRR